MAHSHSLKNMTVLVFGLCCLFFSPLRAWAESDPVPVKIGVLAKRGEAKVYARWNSLGDYLSAANPQYQFQIIPLGFDKIYSAVAGCEVDFVLSNSAYYAGLERKYGVHAIATMKNSREGKSLTSFGGVIFCRADRTDLDGHEDFAGKSFMAVDKKSFGGYHMAWFHLLQHGFDPHRGFTSVRFAGTHDGVVNAVLMGDVDIGTVRTDTLERMASEGKIKLTDLKVFKHDLTTTDSFPFRVTTNLYPEWPMASLSHVAPELVARVTEGLLLMKPADRAAIDAHISGWVSPLNYLPVHECLMGLRVEPYADLDEKSFTETVVEYRGVVAGFASILGLVCFFSFFLSRAKRDVEHELAAKKKTEQKLTQFKTILDQIYDAVFVFDPESLRFVYVNQGAVQQMGYSSEELMNMNPLDMTLDYTEEGFREMLRPLKEGRRKLVSFETSCWHKEGHIVPVYVHLQYIDQGQGTSRYLAVVRDVTTQKVEAEQFRRLFESSMDAIMVIGAKGFVDCNRKALEMFGFESKEEFLKLHPADVSPPTQENGKASFELAEDRIKEAFTNKVALFDGIHRRKDGKCFPAEVLLSPFERDGEMVLHSVVRDVTQRRRSEKEKDKLQAKLLHAQKLEAVGQLAAGIAHEINTPTQYVANNITFLEDVVDDVQEIVALFMKLLARAKEKGTLSPAEIAGAHALLEEVGWEELAIEIPDAISQSREGLKRVTSIVQAMKEFSHPGTKEKAQTDINQVIQTTITVARNEWKYVAEVEAKLSKDLPLIPCLSDEIGQVILNMIVNGSHAIAERLGEKSEEKGRIVLQTSFGADWVEILVSDTGNGIPEDILPRIFDPFFTTKKVGKGTGQGLAICHDVITEKHGGTLTCKSRVGVGTTFVIRLPRT